jgi:hypothetical protein
LPGLDRQPGRLPTKQADLTGLFRVVRPARARPTDVKLYVADALAGLPCLDWAELGAPQVFPIGLIATND